MNKTANKYDCATIPLYIERHNKSMFYSTQKNRWKVVDKCCKIDYDKCVKSDDEKK